MIKTERLKLGMEILTSQINHWTFFPLAMAVLGFFMVRMGMPAEEPDFLLWAVCGLIPVGLFLLRYNVERRWLFLLCHGAVLAAVLGIALLTYLTGAFSGSAFICILCAIVYLVYSVELRFAETPAVYSDCINPIAATLLLVTAELIFHIEDNLLNWDSYCLFILIGILVCYLVVYYLKHYLDFLQVNKSSAGYLPAEEILHSGIGFIFFCAITVVLMLVLNAGWLEKLFGILWEWLKLLLASARDTPQPGGKAEELISVGESGPYGFKGSPIPNLQINEPFWLWEVLEYVAAILIVCGCVYILIRKLKKLFRFLQGRSRKTANGNVVIIDDDCFEIKEKCGIEKRTSGSKSSDLFRRSTPREKIRRLYKKRVLARWTETKDKKALNYMTAKECGEMLSLPDMAKLYEKARYSEEEITYEDIKQMKNG